jgi:hypothetical protein
MEPQHHAKRGPMNAKNLALLAAFLLAGCATMDSGQKFDTSAESRLQIGVTTINDARAWFGQPGQERHHSNGDTGLIYVHMVSHANGITGKAHAQSETLAMEFGPDGKLTRFDTGGTPVSSHQ